MTRIELEDILKRHEQTEKTIKEQIRSEKSKSEHNREAIILSAFPSVASFESVKVQRSIKPNSKLDQVIYELELLERGTNNIIYQLENKLNDINRVYQEIINLESKHSEVLITLYYPTRTYEKAAEIIGCDYSTIKNRRKKAISILYKNILKYRP